MRTFGLLKEFFGVTLLLFVDGSERPPRPSRTFLAGGEEFFFLIFYIFLLCVCPRVRASCEVSFPPDAVLFCARLVLATPRRDLSLH